MESKIVGMAKKNDVCRCIARVYRWGALRPHRCSNPVWKDGYCKTHHMKIPAFYCPACGEQSYTPLPVILPGQYDWKCPKCGERFRIDIGFYEKEEGER